MTSLPKGLKNYFPGKLFVCLNIVKHREIIHCASITAATACMTNSHNYTYIDASSVDTLVKRGFTLFTCIEQFAHMGANRVPILNDQGRIEGIVTQSMVISLFDQQLG
jgi:hypothetical protein